MTVLRQYPAKSTPSCNRNHQYIVDLACMPRLTQDIYRQVLSRCCTVAHIHRRIPATYSKLGSCGTGNVSRNRRKVSSPSGMCSSDSPPVRVCISSPPVMTIKASLSAMHDSFVCCCIRAELQCQSTHSTAGRSTFLASLGSFSRIVNSSSAI